MQAHLKINNRSKLRSWKLVVLLRKTHHKNNNSEQQQCKDAFSFLFLQLFSESILLLLTVVMLQATLGPCHDSAKASSSTNAFSGSGPRLDKSKTKYMSFFFLVQKSVFLYHMEVTGNISCQS